MGDRPTAPKPARTPVSQSPAPAPAAPQPIGHETTARVSPQRPPLPNLFWGALGCMSVLVVGFTVLFLVARPGAAAGTLPAPVPLPPTAVAPAPPAPRPLPDIQPLAPPAPPPPASAEAPSPHAKPAVHPIKVARAPSGSEGGGLAVVTKKKAQKATSENQADDGADDGTAAKMKSADSTASTDKTADQGAADDDQPAPRHREHASDEPDDD